MSLLRGKCALEFAVHGHIMAHPTPMDFRCIKHGLPNTSWLSFKKEFRDAFAPFTYCYRCGLPQKSLMAEEPACHADVPKGRGLCPFSDFIFIVVHCIWHTPATRADMIQNFGLPKALDYNGFIEWAKKENMLAGCYYNALEVFLWFCIRWEKSGSTL